MADYDSDSSVEDAPSGTETSVTLGFVTGRPTEGAISHLGGHSIWLESSSTPTAALARCKVCNSYMSLLLELNGDLPAVFPDDERRLHILCCRKKACSRKSGSVRAFREVKKHKSEKAAARSLGERSEVKPAKLDHGVDLGTALFGATAPPSTNDANPFASSTATSALANPFASLPPLSSLAAKPPQTPRDEHTQRGATEPPIETFAQKLRISSPPISQNPPPKATEPWPAEAAFPPPFPTYDLESDAEFLYPTESKESAAGPSKSDYDADDSTTATSSEKDLFESSHDRTFLRFSERLSHNPDQVLRYEFKGSPLLYSGTDAVASRFVVPHGKSGPAQGIPRCETCGAARVFECQLVPESIAVLEAEEEIVDLEQGMDWGTIILGVCANDCGVVGEVAFREEWVGVQWEERVVRK